MSLEVSKEIVPFNVYHSSDVMTDSFHQAAWVFYRRNSSEGQPYCSMTWIHERFKVLKCKVQAGGKCPVKVIRFWEMYM